MYELLIRPSEAVRNFWIKNMRETVHICNSGSKTEDYWALKIYHKNVVSNKNLAEKTFIAQLTQIQSIFFFKKTKLIKISTVTNCVFRLSSRVSSWHKLLHATFLIKKDDVHDKNTFPKKKLDTKINICSDVNI